MSDSRLELHLVSWNRPTMTELVVRTIAQNTHQSNYRLIVWDNGSDIDTLGMLTNLQENGLIDELIMSPENVGLEAARHAMMAACETDYFVCIDNDCLPPPIVNGRDWLENMVDLMQKYEDYAAISMRTQVMIGTGNIFEFADEDGSDIVEFPHPGGSFRIMQTRVVHEVGGWAEAKPGRGAEERYIGARLYDAGYKTAFAVNIQCLHLFGVRTKTSERWGYAEGMQPEETGHSDIWHPALQNGDDKDEVLKYSSVVNTERYFHA